MTLRVLSIDGGGVRGILPARVLAELESITGRRVHELFDLIAGTATGGILALGLTAPGPDGQPRYRAEELTRLYLKRGPNLFPAPDPIHRLRRLLGLGGAHRPSAEALSEHLGETPLGDAMVDLIIPTFDLASSVPLVLRSDEFAVGLGPRMADVALATSSTPTHFPSVPVELASRTWALTHGGLVANNPAPFAYAAALARAPAAEIVLVSLGSGAQAPGLRHVFAGNRSSRWPLGAARSFELQLQSSGEAQHEMLDAMLAAGGHRERYWRIQPTLGIHAHDDGHSDPVALSYLAEEFVTGVRPTLSEIADHVVPA